LHLGGLVHFRGASGCRTVLHAGFAGIQDDIDSR